MNTALPSRVSAPSPNRRRDIARFGACSLAFHSVCEHDSLRRTLRVTVAEHGLYQEEGAISHSLLAHDWFRSLSGGSWT